MLHMLFMLCLLHLIHVLLSVLLSMYTTSHLLGTLSCPLLVPYQCYGSKQLNKCTPCYYQCILMLHMLCPPLLSYTLLSIQALYNVYIEYSSVISVPICCYQHTNALATYLWLCVSMLLPMYANAIHHVYAIICTIVSTWTICPWLISRVTSHNC